MSLESYHDLDLVLNSIANDRYDLGVGGNLLSGSDIISNCPVMDFNFFVFDSEESHVPLFTAVIFLRFAPKFYIFGHTYGLSPKESL